MNAYVVWTKDERVYVEPILDDGARLLVHDVERHRGEATDNDQGLWWRVHEVLGHDGAPCDATEDEPCVLGEAIA